jgi:signal transduction histidine kinase
MALTPDIEARGMKAYEQARAFERLRSWRLPLSFAVFALIPALSGAWMWAIGHTMMAWLNFVAAVVLAWLGRFQWKQLRARHARNLGLLAALKAEYGDQLPWIQVENHFAELEKLKREIAENSGGRQ